jgi:predicted phage terminase large subunit-like protein
LTERDNLRFVSIIQSEKYQRFWGDIVQLDKTGQEKVSNKQTGWKIASSVGGTGTGERGDFLLVDDPHNVKEGESDAKRESTIFWWREVVPTRLNDYEKSSKIVIMQRVHDEDVSGDILSKKLNFVHLMLPMEYDPTRPCRTPIGGDWRTKEGELLWPERFSANAVRELKREMGEYAVASQFQQSPSPRGGGIIKSDHWNLWDEEYAVRLGLQNINDALTYPRMEFVVASLDSAYTEDKENDFSALTVWGVWRNEYNVPKVMLMDAWEDRLELHGRMPEKPVDQSVIAYLKENKKHWGLVERVCYTCKRFKVDTLLIENKASGKSVAQEMQRLFAEEMFNVVMVEPSGDKVARAYACQPLFSSETVYAPDRGFADKVIERCAAFPKCAAKDLVDSVTQALNWLRNCGWACVPLKLTEWLSAKPAWRMRVSAPLCTTCDKQQQRKINEFRFQFC